MATKNEGLSRFLPQPEKVVDALTSVTAGAATRLADNYYYWKYASLEKIWNPIQAQAQTGVEGAISLANNIAERANHADRLADTLNQPLIIGTQAAILGLIILDDITTPTPEVEKFDLITTRQLIKKETKKVSSIVLTLLTPALITEISHIVSNIQNAENIPSTVAELLVIAFGTHKIVKTGSSVLSKLKSGLSNHKTHLTQIEKRGAPDGHPSKSTPRLSKNPRSRHSVLKKANDLQRKEFFDKLSKKIEQTEAELAVRKVKPLPTDAGSPPPNNTPLILRALTIVRKQSREGTGSAPDENTPTFLKNRK